MITVTEKMTNLIQANVLTPPMFMAQEPQMPSRQERLKVNVESSWFLILINTSRTIGPQLKTSRGESSNRVQRKGYVRVEIDLVLLHFRFDFRSLRIPSVHLYGFDPGGFLLGNATGGRRSHRGRRNVQLLYLL